MQNIRNKNIMLLVLMASAILLVSQSLVTPAAGQVPTTISFIAVLNGAQEVPANSSPYIGVALMTYDRQTRMLSYQIAFTGLITAETGAHFHAPATVGQNAGVLFPIAQTGNPKRGSVGPLNATHEGHLLEGRFYVNIHSAAAGGGFPGGEIRGQLIPLVGAAGAQGPAGLQGAMGPAGAAGAQGPAGLQGAMGPAGAAGAQGSRGPAGEPANPSILYGALGVSILAVILSIAALTKRSRTS